MKPAVTDVQYGNTVDVRITIDSIDVSANVIKLGTISYSKKSQLLSSAGSCAVELDQAVNVPVGVSALVEVSVNGEAHITMLQGIVSESKLDPTTNTCNVILESTRVFEKDVPANARAIDYPDYVEDGNDLPIVFGSGVKYQVGEVFTSTKLSLQTPMGYGLPLTVLISGGSEMPQGTPIDLILAGIVVGGSFNGDAFTITDQDSFNKPFYAGVDLIVANNGDTFGNLTANTRCLVDQYVWISSLGSVNYCYKQTGTKCYFLLPFGNAGTYTMTETSFCQRPEWNVQLDLAAVGSRFWTWDSYYMYEDLIELPPGTAGARRDSSGLSGKNIVNIMANTTVVAVYAYYDFNGVKQLAQLPTCLYAVENVSITNVANCTSVTIWPPLSTRPNSQWSDEIFVTTRSPVARNPTAVATWLANYVGATVTGSFGAWAVDSVTYGTQKVIDLLDNLAYETCTPIRIEGLNLVIVNPQSFAVTNDSRINIVESTANESDLISQISSSYRLNYNKPVRHYRKKGSSPYNNEATHDYIFLTNKQQVVASTDWWFSRLNNLFDKFENTLIHTAYSLDAYDLITGGAYDLQVENISYDLVEPKVIAEGTRYIEPPTIPAAADPALNVSVDIYYVSDAGEFGAPDDTVAVETGWVWDGNEIATAVYGCRKYINNNITGETINSLPAVGSSEGIGAWDSGVTGVCRVKTGVNSNGKMLFVYAFSPSIPYWLVNNQPVILGSPAIVGGKKVYSISWGV